MKSYANENEIVIY